jgi:hypothetical protein
MNRNIDDILRSRLAVFRTSVSLHWSYHEGCSSAQFQVQVGFQSDRREPGEGGSEVIRLGNVWVAGECGEEDQTVDNLAAALAAALAVTRQIFSIKYLHNQLRYSLMGSLRERKPQALEPLSAVVWLATFGRNPGAVFSRSSWVHLCMIDIVCGGNRQPLSS